MNFAKTTFALATTAAILFLSTTTICLAQAAGSQPPLNEVTPDFLVLVVNSLNGLKGAGTLGAAAIIVQLILKAIDQPFANKFFSKQSGLSKLGIVAALTFAVTPLGLMSGAGIGIGAALLHSSTLTAFMVLINQIYQQANASKIDPPPAEIKDLQKAG